MAAAPAQPHVSTGSLAYSPVAARSVVGAAAALVTDALIALGNEAGCELALRLGPAIWPAGVPRDLAAAILTRRDDLPDEGPQYRADLDEHLKCVEAAGARDPRIIDDARSLACIRRLAAERADQFVAHELRAIADSVESSACGVNDARVAVAHMFALAEGELREW